MDAEQTWPTEEELKEAENTRKRLIKKVPKGFSEYQAAWIPDCDAGGALLLLFRFLKIYMLKSKPKYF